MVGRILNLFQVQLDSLRKVGESFVDRPALAGHVHLKALGDIPVLFSVQCRSQRLWHASRVAASSQHPERSKATAGSNGSERYHQQYLSDAKNPYGYCPDHGTGVSCPIGVVKASGSAEAIKAEG
jgi:hypothetical protein